MVLHGFTAVAELKHWPTLSGIPAVVYVLHGFTAVAELKQTRLPISSSLLRVLHGFTAVAELKRRGLVRPEDGRREFSTASPPWPN